MSKVRALGFAVITCLSAVALADDGWGDSWEDAPGVDLPMFTPNLYFENGFNFYPDAEDAFFDDNNYYADPNAGYLIWV
jgi:hypothetical protein